MVTPISGECGEGLTYNLTKDGTLIISGSGKMKSFEKDFIIPNGVSNISLRTEYLKT